MNNRQPRFEQARHRAVNATEMRQAAADFLGWQELTVETACDMTCINKRTWIRFEANERTPPDSVIKLFWWEVAFAKLEELEKDNGVGAVEDELGNKVITIERLLDYAHKAWEKWDPAVKKAERNNDETTTES